MAVQKQQPATPPHSAVLQTAAGREMVFHHETYRLGIPICNKENYVYLCAFNDGVMMHSEGFSLEARYSSGISPSLQPWGWDLALGGILPLQGYPDLPAC